MTIRYNLVPDHTICREQDTPRGTKRQKLRISVFLTVNADGSEKRKPMVIGRAATPRYSREYLYVEQGLSFHWWMIRSGQAALYGPSGIVSAD